MSAPYIVIRSLGQVFVRKLQSSQKCVVIHANGIYLLYCYNIFILYFDNLLVSKLLSTLSVIISIEVLSLQLNSICLLLNLKYLYLIDIL